MKSFLKYAIVLLILFSMIGMASAAVDSITVGTPTANGSNFDVVVSWTGTLDTSQFNITINPGSFLLTSTTNDGSVTFTEAFSTGTTYTVTVEDGPSTMSDTFIILAQPTITNFVSTDSSTATQFNVQWDWTQVSDETLQISSQGTWTNVTANTAMVNGNATDDTVILIRAMNGTSSNYFYSTPVTVATFAPAILTNTSTANSITWTLSNWTYAVNYTITGNITGLVTTNITATGNVVVVTDLNPGEAYTIEVRGTDSTGTNYSLFRTDTVALAAANIFDIPAMNDVLFPNGTERPLPNIEAGTTFSLRAVVTNPASFVWTLINADDSVTVTTRNSVTMPPGALEDTFTWTAVLGNYTLQLTVDDNTNPAQTLSWSFTVTPRSSGDRVWQDGMPTTYTWNARSFSGFYYNLDTGQGSEFMTITNIGRTIERNAITYQTTTSTVDFELSRWGSYQVVGFMGDMYFAGLPANSPVTNRSTEVSLMRTGNLSRVLIDSSEQENFRVGQAIALEEGYSVRIDQINVAGNQVFLVVEKDGRRVAEGIVQSGGTFTHTRNISGQHVPFIAVNVRSVFMGTESSLVTVDGVFQISSNLTRLQSGTRIDSMEIVSVTGDTIRMTNHERINLERGQEVTLMGRMKFVVADSNILRFAPTLEITDPGIHEIRGTVSDFSNPDYIVTEWTPLNFEGFYFDINNDYITESIRITTDLNTTRTIDRGQLIYTANATETEFAFSRWGNYTILGFMGEKYYAGPNGNLLHGGNLSRVLVDSDERRNMRVGQSLALEEGVSVRVDQIDINGRSALLIVERDGRELWSDVVPTGSHLNFTTGSGANRTTFVKVHVESVFMGTESSLVTISGVFQASQNLTRIERGTTYGRMEVVTVNRNGIVLENRERITLDRGNDVEFMTVGNNTTMFFRVGDNSTLRFAPFVQREIGSTDPLTVNLSRSTVVSGDVVTITVVDRGTPIDGVSIIINNATVGTTNADGQVNFTTGPVGTFRVNAERPGFTAGHASLTVNERLMNMTVRVSPDVIHFGTAGVIRATDSLNGSPLSGANVYVSGERVGTTNATGELSHVFNRTGSVTIDVTRAQYNNGSVTINVTQEVAFVYSNFSMNPTEPSARSAIRLSFDIHNNGIRDGSHDISLILRDSYGTIVSQDNSTISVNRGQTRNVTMTVRAPEAGNYTMELVEVSSGNRVINLPPSMSSFSVGESRGIFGNLSDTMTLILYIILGILALIILAVIGFVAYLFGVKGATKDNYKDVAREISGDFKSKFKK